MTFKIRPPSSCSNRLLVGELSRLVNVQVPSFISTGFLGSSCFLIPSSLLLETCCSSVLNFFDSREPWSLIILETYCSSVCFNFFDSLEPDGNPSEEVLLLSHSDK